MKNTNLTQVRNLYDDGYKCIKYENNQNGDLTAYFKNFEKEKSAEITCSIKKEAHEIKSFIDNQSLS